MSKVIISDTSCLIAFDLINQLEILHQTFNTILTTAGVQQEFGKTLPHWVIIQEPTNVQRQAELSKLLDPGEAGAIALALEIKNSVLIIDEKKGRKVARSLNLQIIGSMKVLLIAKQKGIVKHILPFIQQLEKNNFRFSKSLIDQVLAEANEIR